MDRFIKSLIVSVIVALLHARGALERWNVAVDDAMLREAAPAPDARWRERLRVVTVPAPPSGVPFAADHIVAALRSLLTLKREATLVALPAELPSFDEEDAASLRTAAFELGNAILALPPGDAPLPVNSRVDRLGRRVNLLPPPGCDPLHGAIGTSFRSAIGDDLTADADGVLRRSSIAYGEFDQTTSSLSFSLAAHALRESSLHLSPDLRTVAAFGGRDLILAAPAELRIRFHRDRIYEPVELDTLLAAVAANPRAHAGLVLIVAFEGSSLSREFATPQRDTRTGAEIVADAADDLLTARTAHRLPPRAELALVVVVPPLLALGSTRIVTPSRRRLAWLGLGLGFAAAAIAAANLAALLLPLAPLVAALVIVALVASVQRPTIG